MKPLREQEIIPESRRADFLTQVFWNINDIIAVNTRLRDALNKRQKSYAVVEQIGDVLLDAVPHFAPFVSYGAHQLYGKYEFEKEKSSNPAFAAFVEVCRCAEIPSCSKCSHLPIGNRTASRVAQAGAERLFDQTHHPTCSISASFGGRAEAHTG